MKKLIIFAMLALMPALLFCDDGDGDDKSDKSGNYYFNYTLTKFGSSDVLEEGSFTAGPNDAGLDGLPVVSYYEDDNTYICMALETSVPFDTYSSVDGVSFSLVATNTVGTYAANTGNFSAIIEGDNYTKSESWTVTISELGSAGTGNIKGDFSVKTSGPISKGPVTEYYTITGSFNLKRVNDDNSPLTD